jgi:hypothetical protein
VCKMRKGNRAIEAALRSVLSFIIISSNGRDKGEDNHISQSLLSLRQQLSPTSQVRRSVVWEAPKKDAPNVRAYCCVCGFRSVEPKSTVTISY